VVTDVLTENILTIDSGGKVIVYSENDQLELKYTGKRSELARVISVK